MAFIERREIDTRTGNHVPKEPIDQDRPEIIEDFYPAKIHVFCDVLDKGGQVLFSGDFSHLVLAIRREGSEEPEPIDHFVNGVSFEPGDTLFIGSQRTNDAIALDYNPTFDNRVLAHFQRYKKD